MAWQKVVDRTNGEGNGFKEGDSLLHPVKANCSAFSAPLREDTAALERGGLPPLSARTRWRSAKRRQAAALHIDGVHFSVFRQERDSLAVWENEMNAAVIDRRYMNQI